MKRILISLYFGVSIFAIAVGEELLTVQHAVEIALENNYDIRLSQNLLLAAKENKTYGSAGMLPNATTDLTQNNSIQNATQLHNSDVERELDNARNNNLSYGINTGWTIFVGLGMFARGEKLQESEYHAE